VVSLGAQRSPKILWVVWRTLIAHKCFHVRIVLAKTTVFLYSVCV
jgi:hypothetical protein